MQEILNKQRRFFMSGSTRDLDYRRDALKRLQTALRDHGTKLEEALQADLGKSPAESYMCELGMCMNSVREALKNLKKWAAPKRVSTPISQFPASSFIMREPYGVALIISPWNYPLLLSMDPLISALAAGNCCVLRFSSNAPCTAGVLTELIASIFPPEYVTVVGGGTDVAAQLLSLPFDTIFFTGSPNVGRQVMQAAAANLVPVTLELGGKSPCIVDATANISLAARRIAFGKTLNAGQTCVAPDYLLIHRSVKQQFITEYAAAIHEMLGEKPANNLQYARIVNERHFRRLFGLLREAHVCFGGGTREDTLRIEPTLLDELDPDIAPCMQEEIFGPILPMIPFDTIAEVEQFIQSRPKPLACYIFTAERRVEQRLLTSVSSGGACVNDTIVHLAVPNLPFGGVGQSGMGAYHGVTGFNTFTHAKGVLRRSTVLDFPFRYAPFSSWKEKVLRFFLH